MALILPLLLIASSIGIFFGFTDPQYDKVKALRTEVASLDEALDRSKELQEIRDELQSRYRTFSNEDLERISRLVPDNIDNVRLILEIDSVAARYGLVIKNIAVSANAENDGSKKNFGSENNNYGTVSLSFAVSAKYDVLLKFLKDLEDSLRIIDITSITFSAGDREFADYSINLKTYWLK